MAANRDQIANLLARLDSIFGDLSGIHGEAGAAYDEFEERLTEMAQTIIELREALGFTPDEVRAAKLRQFKM